MEYPIAYVALFFVLASSGGTHPLDCNRSTPRIALSFLLPVADRMGLLGGPYAGVTWGDLAHFHNLYGQMNAFMPRAAIPTWLC